MAEVYSSTSCGSAVVYRMVPPMNIQLDSSDEDSDNEQNVIKVDLDRPGEFPEVSQTQETVPEYRPAYFQSGNYPAQQNGLPQLQTFQATNLSAGDYAGEPQLNEINISTYAGGPQLNVINTSALTRLVHDDSLYRRVALEYDLAFGRFSRATYTHDSSAKLGAELYSVPDHSPMYPTVYVSPAGLLTILLQSGIAIEMTTDRTVRVVNHWHKSVAATSGNGTSACIYHDVAKIYQAGQVTDAKLSWHRQCHLSIDEEIAFAYGQLCYKLRGEGVNIGHHQFKDLSGDMSVTLLFGASGYGPHLMDFYQEIAQEARYHCHNDGGVSVSINNLYIHQNAIGETVVSNGPAYIRVSPVSGAIYLETDNIQMAIEKYGMVKIRFGDMSMNANFGNFAVCNKFLEAGFDSTRKLYTNQLFCYTSSLIDKLYSDDELDNDDFDNDQAYHNRNIHRSRSIPIRRSSSKLVSEGHYTHYNGNYRDQHTIDSYGIIGAAKPPRLNGRFSNRPRYHYNSNYNGTDVTTAKTVTRVSCDIDYTQKVANELQIEEPMITQCSISSLHLPLDASERTAPMSNNWNNPTSDSNAKAQCTTKEQLSEDTHEDAKTPIEPTTLDASSEYDISLSNFVDDLLSSVCSQTDYGTVGSQYDMHYNPFIKSQTCCTSDVTHLSQTDLESLSCVPTSDCGNEAVTESEFLSDVGASDVSNVLNMGVTESDKLRATSPSGSLSCCSDSDN